MKQPRYHRQRAFTLIEIMMVVALLALIMTTGIPAIYRMTTKEGMRAAVSDVMEACGHARARAILQGTTVELVFFPSERTFGVGGAAPVRTDDSFGMEAAPPPAAAKSGLSGQFSDDITIEMLDINLLEYRESESARVRFFPNGTSDELTLILRSDKNEWRKITLEVTTALASVGDVQ